MYDESETSVAEVTASPEPQTKEVTLTSKYSTAVVGDVITFGKYEQDGDTSNGPEFIEWEVIDVEEDKIWVISKQILAYSSYVYGKTYNGFRAWEASWVREFLNGEFLETAFTEEEKEYILSQDVHTKEVAYYWGNEPNRNYRTTVAEYDTTDRIFILSIDEANAYLKNNSFCTCSDAILDEAGSDYNSHCYWLRELTIEEYEEGEYEVKGVHVLSGQDDDGSLDIGSREDRGGNEFSPYAGVRPSMWIKIVGKY